MTSPGAAASTACWILGYTSGTSSTAPRAAAGRASPATASSRPAVLTIRVRSCRREPRSRTKSNGLCMDCPLATTQSSLHGTGNDERPFRSRAPQERASRSSSAPGAPRGHPPGTSTRGGSRVGRRSTPKRLDLLARQGRPRRVRLTAHDLVEGLAGSPRVGADQGLAMTEAQLRPQGVLAVRAPVRLQVGDGLRDPFLTEPGECEEVAGAARHVRIALGADPGQQPLRLVEPRLLVQRDALGEPA